MPVLSNAKHEAFAQSVAKGLSASEAYASAGYKPNQPSASRLLSNVIVAARVTELQTKASEKAEWSAADRLKSLKMIFDRTESGDPRVAISAIAEANKMAGSYAPAKMDHLSSDGTMTPKPSFDPSKLSTSALAEIMAASDEAAKQE